MSHLINLYTVTEIMFLYYHIKCILSERCKFKRILSYVKKEQSGGHPLFFFILPSWTLCLKSQTWTLSYAVQERGGSSREHHIQLNDWVLVHEVERKAAQGVLVFALRRSEALLRRPPSIAAAYMHTLFLYLTLYTAGPNRGPHSSVYFRLSAPRAS